MEENKVHLWIGSVNISQEEYLKYFKLDYSTEGDFDDPNYKVCGFCTDIGKKWFDHDFIGIIPLFGKEIELDEILEEAAIDEYEWDNVKEVCKSLGIKKANAILWYQDSSLEIKEPKESYNGLKYIGLFEGD
ncbi:immunity 22 family protein [Tenacibaculum sp. XPcli2-G]|uniref:immunity 22 family protein n=1 Tax=Tenacibaculum sp. XPcli2-G TaxID=2954503 RepID=UPI002097673A|nr:immunity 22 family protein [Tenacibaculum sp. XPcli2-G]MCO7184500.1 immunity 22 family protein [Tenacibaculum sp. XPcli2-G]